MITDILFEGRGLDEISEGDIDPQTLSALFDQCLYQLIVFHMTMARRSGMSLADGAASLLSVMSLSLARGSLSMGLHRDKYMGLCAKAYDGVMHGQDVDERTSVDLSAMMKMEPQGNA